MAAARRAVFLWRSRKHGILLGSCARNSTAEQCCRCLSTTMPAHTTEKSSSSAVGHAGAKKAEKISMAMKAYLERAKSHEMFMQKEVAEYEVGKRHLANIMGADPDNFSQEDINEAIEYLLPSGVHAKHARPMMKHPLDVIPQKKDAQFGIDGRPYHSLFYTGLPNFFKTMHDLAVTFEELKNIEADMIKKGMTPLLKMNLGGSQWIEKTVFENQLAETLTDNEYGQFIYMLERIADHPWAHRHEALIMKYRKILPIQAQQDIPEPLVSESGRKYQVAEGQRKTAVAKVTVWDHGTGEVNINGKDLLTYFPCILDREQIMFPLQFTNKLGEVDFEATLESGGHSCQAGALRLALSRALSSLVDKTMVEKLRLAGLLTQDPRRRERKKFGQEGARRKHLWKKR